MSVKHRQLLILREFNYAYDIARTNQIFWLTAGRTQSACKPQRNTCTASIQLECASRTSHVDKAERPEAAITINYRDSNVTFSPTYRSKNVEDGVSILSSCVRAEFSALLVPQSLTESLRQGYIRSSDDDEICRAYTKCKEQGTLSIYVNT